jgi:hydroxypyruvate isomerase
MLRLCANLKWLFTEHPFLDRFNAAANAGFTAVEYPSPYEYSAAKLRQLLKQNGLKQILINTPVGPATQGEASGMACIPGRETAFRDGLKKALDFAVELECPLVHVLAGIQPADVAHESASAVYLENISWAAELAEKAQVMLTLESINQRDIPGFFLRTQEQAANVIDIVGRERVGIQFDIYHCQVQQGDVTRRLETLMPKIAHIQIADAPLRNEPGTGEIAWEYVIRRIEQLGYQGWVGCEYAPASSTVAGLKWRDRFSH